MGRERLDVFEQRLSQQRRDLEGALKLCGRQLQQHAETVRLGALTALDEAFPHLPLLPHLLKPPALQPTAFYSSTNLTSPASEPVFAEC